MVENIKTPTTAEELREAILAHYDTLSKRLQQIARYVLDEPSVVALETLAVLAERTGVQPSAIVRFAKTFGFEGATQMQRLFRDGLLSSSASLGYGERIREFSRQVDGKQAGVPSQVLSEFVEGSIMALQRLEETVDKADLAHAVQLIANADTVYVAGFRRSFPVAAYLAYSLHQVDKRAVLVDSVGGMTRQQIYGVARNDLLLVVSYHPYAEEAAHLVDVAVDRQCPVLSISDSLVSPIAKPATLVLQAREAEVRKFRSLSTSMCLAQALVISYALAKATEVRNPSALQAPRRRGRPPQKGK